MRLLTHNMLANNAKGVTKGFPLGLEVTAVETKEAEFNPDFLKKMVPKLEWGAFCEAAAVIGVTGFPTAVTPDLFEDEAFLKKFHNALLEVHVEEGVLICPESGRRFAINKGIPNMLLNEDEC
ncbi:hypothetical protein CYMTET_7709 [Cymbomonas tetramitiformis]|uniref:Multifunctional methyltransferase subunit TRM112-like protein n=1 Tax=Cymbomonas tetramitiformis TaxID=36881 RepID=A0AAE0GWF2_9CHLO|nr:hypothetical protein CYMTET_7709 [Cymbomonas tetramitiformis]